MSKLLITTKLVQNYKTKHNLLWESAQSYSYAVL
jgi:hypothetical protein